MVLLRRVIGDALRARRQGQHRTLREVSTAANVSLGYLSEIERGQKEASSELLAAICDALGAQLSEVLREASDTLSVAEQMEGVFVPVDGGAAAEAAAAGAAAARAAILGAERAARAGGAPARIRVPLQTESARKIKSESARKVTGEGEVSVSVRHDAPLRTTLRATRGLRAERERDVMYAA